METYIHKLEKEMISAKYDLAYINLCKEYAQRLITNNLPVIFDIDHLSLLLGLDKRYIYGLTNNTDFYYKEFSLDKKNGGSRDINVPNRTLKNVQKWILENILEKIQITPYAKGFKKKLSIVDNAKEHIGKECVITLDINDFFPSISEKQIYRIFKKNGFTYELSCIFSKLCTCYGVLPQGAPTSPYLSNICCIQLDRRLSSLAKKINASYTRYADDITFSGEKKIVNSIPLVKKIIIDSGFRVNDKKTRIRYSHERQMVTGLIVNKKLSVPKQLKNDLRKHIHYCELYGVNNHMNKINTNRCNFKEYLFGIAYFIKMVEKDKGLIFLEKLRNINWNE